MSFVPVWTIDYRTLCLNIQMSPLRYTSTELSPDSMHLATPFPLRFTPWPWIKDRLLPGRKWSDEAFRQEVRLRVYKLQWPYRESCIKIAPLRHCFTKSVELLSSCRCIFRPLQETSLFLILPAWQSSTIAVKLIFYLLAICTWLHCMY